MPTLAKKSVIVLGITSVMSGCAFFPKTATEYMTTWGGSHQAEDYELDRDEYSDATRFIYAIRHIEPEKNVNNLDNFHEDIDTVKLHKRSSDINVTSAATIGMAALGKISSFDAAMGLLAQQGAKPDYIPVLGEQMLYTIVKVDKSKDLDAQGLAANQISINTVKAAMGSEAKDIYFPTENGYLIFEFNQVQGSDDASCNAVYSPCISNIWRIPYLVQGNNGQIPLAPQGDYIATKTWLPIGFPIEKLKFTGIDGVEQFLYVPPVKINQNKTLWKKKNLKYFTEWYKKERVSINPYLKRLSDNTIMYFNSEITAKQKDSHSLYRVFDFGDVEE